MCTEVVLTNISFTLAWLSSAMTAWILLTFIYWCGFGNPKYKGILMTLVIACTWPVVIVCAGIYKLLKNRITKQGDLNER